MLDHNTALSIVFVHWLIHNEINPKIHCIIHLSLSIVQFTLPQQKRQNSAGYGPSASSETVLTFMALFPRVPSLSLRFCQYTRYSSFISCEATPPRSEWYDITYLAFSDNIAWWRASRFGDRRFKRADFKDFSQCIVGCFMNYNLLKIMSQCCGVISLSNHSVLRTEIPV